MKRSPVYLEARIITAIVLSIALSLTARAQVPGIINYQGRVIAGGTNFDGTGQFKFALVNSAGTTNFWALRHRLEELERRLNAGGK